MYRCHNCSKLYFEPEPDTRFVHSIYPHTEEIEICPHCGARVDNLMFGEDIVSDEELLEMLNGINYWKLKKGVKEWAKL